MEEMKSIAYEIPVVGSFEKVTGGQFIKEAVKNLLTVDEESGADCYRGIKLPARATAGSAGYDFFSPFKMTIVPGETVTVPTGIRAKIAHGWVLMLFPRSSFGFKYSMRLNNTVGIIDSDYYGAENEGHIMIKITNGSSEEKVLSVESGQAFAQGVFLPFGLADGDSADAARKGGFGSTDE